MSQTITYSLIIIPGLSNDVRLLTFISRNWHHKHSLRTYVYSMQWKDKSESFTSKLQRLLIFIDKLIASGEQVSLLGISAGGSVAINVYAQRAAKIHKVVSLCGRLQVGRNVYPSLVVAGKNSPSFVESVRQAEEALQNMPVSLKNKIMTIRPKFGDLIVPTKTVGVKGAKNIEIFATGHIFSICFALQFPKRIMNFIKR